MSDSESLKTSLEAFSEAAKRAAASTGQAVQAMQEVADDSGDWITLRLGAMPDDMRVVLAEFDGVWLDREGLLHDRAFEDALALAAGLEVELVPMGEFASRADVFPEIVAEVFEVRAL